MTLPYVHKTSFATSNYSFTTTQGKGAEVRIPSRLNLDGFGLVLIVDKNSKFQNATTTGLVGYEGGSLVVRLSPAQVDEIGDSFYRIRVDRVGGTSFILVEGTIDYRSLSDLEDKEGLLDANGQIKVQYLPALYDAVAEQFLRRDEFVAGVVDPVVLEQAVEAKLSAHVNSTTPHPAYDLDAPEFLLIFENGLI